MFHSAMDMLRETCENIIPQEASKIGPPSAHQQNAIYMAFRCRTDGGLRLFTGWELIEPCDHVVLYLCGV